MAGFITHRPKIAVTGPNRGGEAAWIFTALSIWMGGGRPVRIRPNRPRDLSRLHGLVVGGGSDVDPVAYEQQGFIDEYLNQTLRDKRKTWFVRIRSAANLIIFPLIFFIRKALSRKSPSFDKERDQLEIKLIDEAVNARLPILGICRGAQLLNVYFKGDLFQDINSFYFETPNRHSVLPVKTIAVEPSSRLGGILQTDELKVNALHDQAVKTPGKGVKVTARENNGVIQGIEYASGDFVVGVQWHPEYLIHDKRQRRIFKNLVEIAKKQKEGAQ